MPASLVTQLCILAYRRASPFDCNVSMQQARLQNCHIMLCTVMLCLHDTDSHTACPATQVNSLEMVVHGQLLIQVRH